ncbi:DUF2628 domain-containing protein [Pseudomonas sp. Fl4BN1]|uniref:DUF2628 domain-containing protein n=1 Tax=Pseudomonas sp. Fl4BN1 TaxID=2697651 RepID=UPI0013766593|nr:DUF2628 domain-containing protein [Pseudomonas sp. Fl4BN1]NBF10914.1 DUF2628 domain-containing protein [Pseudomonas sp. Fl4BN1]
MSRVLTPETIERINRHLMRGQRGDVETTCILLTIILIPCIIGISLLNGPLFAKIILCGFLCVFAAGWCAIKWANLQEQPKADVSGLEVEQLEGYFDRQWVRVGGGKPYVKYSFNEYLLHSRTSADTFFHGDRQLKLNRRYRVDALYVTGLTSYDTGYYLLEETFKQITDDRDLSSEQKKQVAEREKRISLWLKAQQKRLYRIYQNPKGELAAVAVGFNFAACFLSLFWSFFAGLYWVTGIALIALSLALLLPNAADDRHWFWLGLLLSAGIFGVLGNRWRERHVLSKGFVQVDALLSCNPDQAKVAYKRKVEEAAPEFGQ